MLISSKKPGPGRAEEGEINKKPSRGLVCWLIVYMNSKVGCVFRNYPL